MIVKKILTLIAFVLVSFLSIGNVYSMEADVFVQSTVNRAAKTLGGNLTKEERVEKLKDIARDTVDIRGIGYYSLGQYRKNLSSEKKKNMTRYLKNIF